MQRVDGAPWVNHAAKRLLEAINVAHVVHMRSSLALLNGGRPPEPEDLAGLDAGDPEDEIVAGDIVGHGTTRKVGTGDVVEAEMGSAQGETTRHLV